MNNEVLIEIAKQNPWCATVVFLGLLAFFYFVFRLFIKFWTD